MLLLIFAGGCGRSRAAVGGQPQDSGLSFKDSRAADTGRVDRALAKPDAGCHCPTGQGWLRGPCVPTGELAQCVPLCDPKAPNSCPKGQVCDRWAATPFCYSAAALPACVPGPAMGFAPGSLRISPTNGVAGKAVTLTVEGGSFYIGALHWLVSLGNISSGPVTQGGNCQLRATFVPPKPGAYPVLVGYGGKPKILAGFFTASGGSAPPNWIQPGYPCGAGDTCATASGYTCACKQGRCACTP